MITLTLDKHEYQCIDKQGAINLLQISIKADEHDRDQWDEAQKQNNVKQEIPEFNLPKELK